MFAKWWLQMKKAKLTLLSVSIVLSSFFSVITPGRAQANRAQAISDTSAEPIVIDSSVNANTQSQMRTRTRPSGRTIVNITGCDCSLSPSSQCRECTLSCNGQRSFRYIRNACRGRLCQLVANQPQRHYIWRTGCNRY